MYTVVGLIKLLKPISAPLFFAVSVFLSGFSRTEFRGKLAIAITANFTNRNTTAEAKVEEISGVAFIFNQKFFLDLKEETGRWKSIKHTIITVTRPALLMLNLLGELIFILCADHNWPKGQSI